MLCVHLDAVASSLSFIGTCVIGVDALQAPRRARMHLGDETWKMRRPPEANPDAPPLDFWIAGLTFWGAVVGLGLISSGFLLDLYTKVLENPLLYSS